MEDAAPEPSQGLQFLQGLTMKFQPGGDSSQRAGWAINVEHVGGTEIHVDEWLHKFNQQVAWEVIGKEGKESSS